MIRTYSHNQRMKGCEMELACKSEFAKRGIVLHDFGNCVACYCTNGCDECFDDEYCKPDFIIPDLNIRVEVTGYNPADPGDKPGIRLSWPIFVSKCKIDNFIAAFRSGQCDVEYVYHYSTITAFDYTNGKPVPLLIDHIRVVRMDGDFIQAYEAGSFEVITLDQDVMVKIDSNSPFVIYPGKMFEEIALKKISKTKGLS